MSASIFQAVIEAQRRVQEELLRKRNVVGVAVGYRESQGKQTDEPAVAVLVEQKLPEAALSESDMVPREVNGVRTDVFEVGYLRALQTGNNPRDKFRPVIPAGVSMGHYKVTAGTLGVVVKDRATGAKLLLSNNHVFANSNEATKGDAIYQPAPMDGGTESDKVATLERFITLKYLEGQVGTPQPEPTPTPNPSPTQPSGCDITDVFVGLANALAKLSGSEKRVEATSLSAASLSAVATAVAATEGLDNLLDAALARPVNPDMFSPNIRHIGSIQGTKAPFIGQKIRKVGRTTDYSESTVTLLNATVNVGYNTSAGTRTARFTGQVICDVMSQGGDSGSLIVEQDSQDAVGLLFAGSTLATIFTPIDIVLSNLNITF